ncbi:MAG: NRDE family protein [Verrucomicrobiae bacterium]|nr:NRDE family protein [Verrucomicrobiae bacterium]
MCSVTFWPKGRNYRLAMNRDELRSRVAALPPSVHEVYGRRVLHPREPGGGTWINLNDAGITLALVNGYAETARAPAPVASRGGVVLAARTADQPDQVTVLVGALPLAQMNPFRLIGIFPGTGTVHEWRWNRVALTARSHPWAPRQWISSGFDEAGARRARSGVFQRCREAADAGSEAWLHRLHASHEPMRGPYSTCMHRADAATVSYTEIESFHGRQVMRYRSGSPCGCGMLISTDLTQAANSGWRR